MKKNFILLLISLLSANCFYSQSGDLSNFSLSVVLPDPSADIGTQHITMLSNKIKDIVTKNGIASEGNQNFVIYPVFQVVDKRSVEGARSTKTALCDFSLYIKEIGTGTIFSSYNKSITGSSYSSHDMAVTNAIQLIKTDDTEIKKFIETGKQKILDYYNNNCGMILTKVEADRKVKDYDAALAALLSIPQQATSCFNQAQAKIPAVFDEVQRQHCADYIQRARTYATNNDFATAMSWIRRVDPTGPCKEEAKKLIESWEKPADEQQAIMLDYTLKIYQGKVEVAKARAEAMTTVATAYLLTRPQPQYHIIIR